MRATAFQNVLPDNDVINPRRLLVCSGKIGHNLRVEREKRKDMGVGIIFVEQIYPWPEDELQAALDQHPDAEEIVWVQEEPANMGALLLRDAAAAASGRRSRGAQREAQRQRQSGDRIGQGARDGREDPDRSCVRRLDGLDHCFVQMICHAPPLRGGVLFLDGLLYIL